MIIKTFLVFVALYAIPVGIVGMLHIHGMTGLYVADGAFVVQVAVMIWLFRTRRIVAAYTGLAVVACSIIFFLVNILR